MDNRREELEDRFRPWKNETFPVGGFFVYSGIVITCSICGRKGQGSWSLDFQREDGTFKEFCGECMEDVDDLDDFLSWVVLVHG